MGTKKTEKPILERIHKSLAGLLTETKSATKQALGPRCKYNDDGSVDEDWAALIDERAICTLPQPKLPKIKGMKRGPHKWWTPTIRLDKH